MDFLWPSVVIGIGGTAALDLWALLLSAVFGLPAPNWGLVGRWFAHLAKGTFFHKDITAATAVPNEAALGWFAHYAIGIIYARRIDRLRRTRLAFKSNLSSRHGLWAW